MTSLLQRAFEKAAQLSPEEQDVLAARLLAELAEEDEFDRAISASSGQLADYARDVIRDYREGRTQGLRLDEP